MYLFPHQSLFHRLPDGVIDSTMFNRYQGFRALIPAGDTDEWARVQMDTEEDIDVVDTSGPAGLETIGQVTWQFGFQGVSETVRLSNLRAVRKNSLPVLVEMIDYRRRQVSPNPAAGPRWHYEFEFLEVSS